MDTVFSLARRRHTRRDVPARSKEPGVTHACEAFSTTVQGCRGAPGVLGKQVEVVEVNIHGSQLMHHDRKSTWIVRHLFPIAVIQTMVDHPTASWDAMQDGKVFYRRQQIYNISNKLPKLEDFVVAGCKYGGPLGMVCSGISQSNPTLFIH